MSSGFGTIADPNDTYLRFEQLNELVDRCKETANRHGERFNIFSILGVQREEARTHSRFLAELLNPSGRHGEANCFLEIFLEQILGVPSALIGSVRVTRELSTEDQRRVDIVVESPDLILGIEVKIDADDQKAQLHDYYRELERRAGGRKTVVLAYLTLDGKQPSQCSLKDLPPQTVHCLSFSEDVHRWLTACRAQSPHKPELSHALIQYQRLIENLTGTGASMKSLLASEFLSNPDALDTALEAEKALPLAKSKIILQFWNDLSSGLTTAFGKVPTVYGGKSLKEISDNYFNKSRDNKHVGIKLPICHIGSDTVSLYVHIFHVIHYGLRVDNAYGKPISRPEIRAKLRATLNAGNAVADKDSDWLVCYYDDSASGKEQFVLNFHDFNESVRNLIDEEKRRAIVNSMVEHQVRLVKTARSLLDN